MEKDTLQAKSSSGGFYNVTFRFSNGRLSVFCDCQAGKNRLLCKHKLAFLLFDISTLYDPNQVDKLKDIQEWVKQTDFPILISKLKKAESDLEDKKKEVESIKKELTKKMGSEF